MDNEKEAKSIQISQKAMTVSTVLVGLILIGSVILTLTMQPGIIETAADGSFRLLAVLALAAGYFVMY